MPSARKQIQFLVTEIGILPSEAERIVRDAEEQGRPNEHDDYDAATVTDADVERMVAWWLYTPVVPVAMKGMMSARQLE